MEPRDVKTLLLLEAIDKEECQSQRELSRKLNMSLGLVNTFIQDLKSRGIFQTSSQSNNNKKYLLSPKGRVEKANMAKQYLLYSIRYYNEIKRKITVFLEKIQNNGGQNIIFYGAGELCEIACVTIGEDYFRNLKIIDDIKAGRRICGLEIQKETILKNVHFDAMVIMDFENISLIRSSLIDKGIPDEKIYEIPFH